MTSSSVPAPRRAWLVAALVVGALVRLAAITLPGTGDMGVYKLWTYNAATENPATLYGVGAPTDDWHVIHFDSGEGVITYPPFAIYELGVAGRLYKWINGGAFPNTTGLTIAIKLLIFAFEGALALLIFLGVRRLAGERAARWATIAYWLNPSMILACGMLAYVDAFAMLPAAGALLAAALGMPFVSGALIVAATLSKPQCLILMPASALVILAGRDWTDLDWNGALRRATSYAAGAGVAAVAILGNIIAIGAFPNLWFAMSGLARHDMLSGNATNLWWFIGYVLRVRYSLDMGTWNAITMEPRILAISRVIELGYPNPRIVGTVLAIIVMLWGLWTARRAKDWFMLSATGAFLIHAYATLAAQVHENHLYAAIPLLVIASATRPRYRPLLWMLTAIFALNLNAFYGISEFEWRGAYMIPRSITVLDITVWLSLANCAALVWHARLLKKESQLA